MNEVEHRPVVEVETGRPFTELFEALDQAGFETARRPAFEERSDELVEIFAVYLIEQAADPVIDRLIATVRVWATTWLRRFLHERGQPGVTITIYGPHEEVLSVLEVDDE